MRKTILCLSCLILIGFATVLVAAPASEVEALSQDVETVEVEQEAASVESSEAPLCAVSTGLAWGPNYCGDPCTQEGQEVGCIDTSGPYWVRTFCTCTNGTLTC